MLPARTPAQDSGPSTPADLKPATEPTIAAVPQSGPSRAEEPDLAFLSSLVEKSPDIPPGPPYRHLNDAAERYELPILGPGSVQVWYLRPGHPELQVQPEDVTADPAKLDQTHALLGSIRGGELEDVWIALQGENWSERGEARGLIQGLGLHHTSMSVGDVLVDPNVGTAVVDHFGFLRR